jgi:hypothetical protein
VSSSRERNLRSSLEERPFGSVSIDGHLLLSFVILRGSQELAPQDDGPFNKKALGPSAFFF